MKKLGDLVLPNQLIWTDKYEPAGVAQSVARTLGGNPVVFTASLKGGRNITLEANKGVCWLNADEVAAIKLMADSPGATYDLTWGEETMTVVFRHHEPPAVELTPLYPLMDEYPKDGRSLFHGTIKLTTLD